MPAPRPLPTVVGPTENALRALLVRTLAASGIDGYPAWVALNAVAAAETDAWRSSVATALKVDVETVDAVARGLHDTGFLADGVLTDSGRARLGSARTAVSAATAGLVEGLAPEEQETTRRVLDHLRRRAEEALASA